MKDSTKATSALASLLAFATLPANALPIDSMDKPFNEYSWVTTHNSYEKINQNLKEIPQQLNDGVRGFMLDLYFKPQYSKPEEQVRVCHKTTCYGTLLNQLKNEFAPFLRNNPTEVVTLFLESYIERNQLQAVFDATPELAQYSFNPKNFTGDDWPTLKEMTTNQGRVLLLKDTVPKTNRLVIFTASTNLVGDYEVAGKTITVLYDNSWIVENHWEALGKSASGIEREHGWSCPTRNDALPLSTKRVDEITGKKWKRLFLMNQFHHWTSTAPDSAAYDNNLTYLMRRVDNCGVTPNFFGVNNYKSGEVDRYTNALNNGGIYFYEGNNADKKQDAVCVVPTTQGNVNLKANGCENDEARSLNLSGVAKGTRITLFDSPSGNTQDDHLIIDVKRDIGIQERVLLPNFQTNYNNSNYQVVYNRNNGLNGKLSRITIGKTPTDFSDATIAFYEGNNISQNLECVIPFSSVYNISMGSNGYGCANDEIRSAKINKAKAGSSFTLTGAKGGSFKEGRTDVKVLRDITSPLTINSFNQSFKNDYVEVIHHDKAIDGKISFGYIGGKK